MSKTRAGIRFASSGDLDFAKPLRRIVRRYLLQPQVRRCGRMYLLLKAVIFGSALLVSYVGMFLCAEMPWAVLLCATAFQVSALLLAVFPHVAHVHYVALSRLIARKVTQTQITYRCTTLAGVWRRISGF